MKIAVLCGGLSPERNVSISSGTKIAGALQESGHQVVLLDMFFGLEDYTGDIAHVFDDPPALGGTRIDESAPDLEAVRAQRKLQSPSLFGEHVLEVCAMADIVFLALPGRITSGSSIFNPSWVSQTRSSSALYQPFTVRLPSLCVRSGPLCLFCPICTLNFEQRLFTLHYTQNGCKIQSIFYCFLAKFYKRREVRRF